VNLAFLVMYTVIRLDYCFNLKLNFEKYQHDINLNL
jgi:hypothetical protein